MLNCVQTKQNEANPREVTLLNGTSPTEANECNLTLKTFQSDSGDKEGPQITVPPEYSCFVVSEFF